MYKVCLYFLSFIMWYLGVKTLCNLQVVNQTSRQPKTNKECETPHVYLCQGLVEITVVFFLI